MLFPYFSCLISQLFYLIFSFFGSQRRARLFKYMKETFTVPGRRAKKEPVCQKRQREREACRAGERERNSELLYDFSEQGWWSALKREPDAQQSKKENTVWMLYIVLRLSHTKSGRHHPATVYSVCRGSRHTHVTQEPLICCVQFTCSERKRRRGALIHLGPALRE